MFLKKLFESKKFYSFKLRSSKKKDILPLTNNVIIKLNEITTMIEDKNRLTEDEIEEIKTIFKNIIDGGERYDVDDIESWFENEGSWNDKSIRIRITNLAHYVQNKEQQSMKLNIISDDDCGCGN